MQLPDLTGRRYLVTGANAGLGYATVAALAAAGATVVLAVRDLGRGEAAMARLRARQPDARLVLGRLDLADLASVAEFATQQADQGPLDGLVNNAGLMLVPTRQLTGRWLRVADGGEPPRALRLDRSAVARPGCRAHGRVVSLSSIAHRLTGHLDPRLGTAGPYGAMNNYAQSKLACALFGFELDRRLKAAGSPVTSVVAHPGYVATELFGRQRRPSLSDRLTALVTPVVGSRPRHGALSQLRAVTDPTLVGGEFIGPRLLVRGAPVRQAPGPNALDPAAAALLWDLSGTLTGSVFDVDRV